MKRRFRKKISGLINNGVIEKKADLDITKIDTGIAIVEINELYGNIEMSLSKIVDELRQKKHHGQWTY